MTRWCQNFLMLSLFDFPGRRTVTPVDGDPNRPTDPRNSSIALRPNCRNVSKAFICVRRNGVFFSAFQLRSKECSVVKYHPVSRAGSVDVFVQQQQRQKIRALIAPSWWSSRVEADCCVSEWHSFIPVGPLSVSVTVMVVAGIRTAGPFSKTPPAGPCCRGPPDPRGLLRGPGSS